MADLFTVDVATSAALMAVAWFPVSTATHLTFGQYLKRLKWIRNCWLDHLLPFIAVVGFALVMCAGILLRYAIHPLTAFAFFGAHFGGATGAKGVYNGQKVPDPNAEEPGTPGWLARIPVIGPIIANSMTPGPDNHPADAASSTANTPSNIGTAAKGVAS